MAHTTSQSKPIVAIGENQKVLYERKWFFIFSWWVKIKTESIGQDLYIETNELYENIYLNGELLSNK